MINGIIIAIAAVGILVTKYFANKVILSWPATNEAKESYLTKHGIFLTIYVVLALAIVVSAGILIF